MEDLRRDVENYLIEIKQSIKENRYRIDRNSRRQDNIDLFFYYILSEEKAKKNIVKFNNRRFLEKRNNTHVGYEHEQLYVFGKDVTLLERFGDGERNVSLYIKFNKLSDGFTMGIYFMNRDSHFIFHLSKKVIFGGIENENIRKHNLLFRV